MIVLSTVEMKNKRKNSTTANGYYLKKKSRYRAKHCREDKAEGFGV